MIRVIEYLLFLFIFLIPWQARWVLRAGELNGGFWEYGTVALYATDVLFVLVIFLSIIWFFREKRKTAHFSLFKPQTETFALTHAGQLPHSESQGSQRSVFPLAGSLFLAWAFVSLLWATDSSVAVFATFKLLEGILLFVFVTQLPLDRTKLLSIFIASAVVQSVLAIAQFFTQSVFVWPWSGIAPQDPSDLGVAVVQFGEERWLRAYGSFPHPNLLGAFLAIALLFSLSKIKSQITNHKSQINSKFQVFNFKLSLVSCLLLLTLGLFFTFSRAAWFAFAVGLVVLVVQQKLWRERLFQQLSGIGILLGMVLLVLFFPLIQTRFTGVQRLELKSTAERFVGYREAWQLIIRHPTLGVGMGNETAALHAEIRSNDPPWSYQPVHNVFLLILSELGVVGLLFSLGLLWQTKKSIVQNFSFIILLFVLFLFDHSFWTLRSGVLLFGLTIALTMISSHASFFSYGRKKISK